MSKPTLAFYGIKDRNDYRYPGYVHDHNLCLMADGKVEQYLHLERWSRRKYDNRLDLYLEDLCQEGLLDLPDDFDVVSVNSFVGNCFISKNGRVRIEPHSLPIKIESPIPALNWWEKQDWDGLPLNSFILSHELAHVGSCLPFYGNFRDNSLLVHFDGGASEGNFSAFLYKDGQLKHLETHWELAQLSTFFNSNALSFALVNALPGEHCAVPGKLMGYAAKGQYRPELGEWLRKHNYFKDIWEKPEIFLGAAKQDWGVYLDGFDNRQPFLQDVAAVFQHDFEAGISSHLANIQKRVRADYLYYAGGCALNIVFNTRLLEKNIFKEIFIPPCCNDSGLSLGAASILEMKKHGHVSQHLPYLNNIGVQSEYGHGPATIQRVAEELMASKVIGVCNGPGEAGPRALGNRSLIALPNDPALTRRVSMECKQREWYRPTAPIMLARNVQRVTGKPAHHLANYMLMDYRPLPAYQQALSGVIHTNGTARIQALPNRQFNPFMYDLLDYMENQYGVIALINTSFNAQGEPIVHTEEQALKAAQKMSLDGVVLNGQYHTTRQYSFTCPLRLPLSGLNSLIISKGGER